MGNGTQNNGQYLPKLGPNGTSNATIANSHNQLPQFSQQSTLVAG